jgi:hypothetical protein
LTVVHVLDQQLVLFVRLLLFYITLHENSTVGILFFQLIRGISFMSDQNLNGIVIPSRENRPYYEP